MFATVRIDTPLSESSVTSSNRLRSPCRARAGRDRYRREANRLRPAQPGLFEGVEVQLGPRIGEIYPVLKGLQAGEKVAAAGAFLIDAETGSIHRPQRPTTAPAAGRLPAPPEM